MIKVSCYVPLPANYFSNELVSHSRADFQLIYKPLNPRVETVTYELN